MKLLKTFSLALLLCPLQESFAKVIQIIHTNDLHSYFQGTRGGIGGYAQLKTVLDEVRAEAKSKGIPSLHLDAGDFGEGSSFYFSDRGADSMRALDLLGIDVTVLGNHDFILGGRELRKQMIQSKLKAKLLSANLKGKWLMGLKNLVPSYYDYSLDDLKIRIIGLTTNEVHYMYPLRPLGYIAKPIKAGIKEANRAQKHGVDFTIALTHIGLSEDINLVRSTRTIDLVVGGHTHIKLSRPEFTKNLEGKSIPIVHAGAHSGYVGVMTLDVDKDGSHKILEYRMIDIKKDMPKEETMAAFVEASVQKREAYFGRPWNDLIGYSDIPLSGNINGQDGEQNTCWSRHMARLTRKSAKTDLGLQFEVFQGEQIPPGKITFGDVVDNFPHFRKWGDAGWKVSRAYISGFLLKKILDALSHSEYAIQVTVDGVRAKKTTGIGTVSYDPRTHRVEEALVNGLPIENLRFYSVGIPSEIPFAMKQFLGLAGYLILIDMRTIESAPFWPIIEDYIRTNSPLSCELD